MLTTAIAFALIAQTPAAEVKLTRIRTLDNVKSIAVTAASTGSRIAVSSEDRKVRLIDVAKGTTLATLTGHPQPVYGIAFNQAGTLLATGDESARIWIWDTKTGKKLREFTRVDAHTRGIQNLSFSADGRQLLSTGKDDVLIVWDVASGKRLRKILGAGINFYGARFAPTGGRIYTGTLGKGAAWYATSTGKILGNSDGTNGQGVLDVDVSRDGTRVLAAGRDNRAQWIDTKTGKRLAFLSGHSDWVVRATISPNGRYGATASSDRSVRVWNMRTLKSIATLENQSAVGSTITFTGDGKYFISSSDQESLLIWSVTPSQGITVTTTKKKRI